MKRTAILALALWAATGAKATPVLTLSPADGTVSGSAGQTIGWGFDLTSDPSLWISIISTSIETDSNPALGAYQDFMGINGGPTAGFLEPGAPDWVQAFDANLFTGFGSFAIDPSAAVGDSDTGILLYEYELFSGDPSTCGGCFAGSGFGAQPFTVNVVSAAPEPETWCLMLCGIAGIIGVRRMTRKNILGRPVAD